MPPPRSANDRLARMAAAAVPTAVCALFVAARLHPEAALAAWLAPVMPMQAIVVHAGLLLRLAVLVVITLTFGVSGASPSIEEWTDVRSRLFAGTFYFGILAAIESTGLYLALRRVPEAT